MIMLDSDDQSVYPVLAQDADSNLEREALARCHADMSRLQNDAPDWYAFYEDAQPDSAEKAVLIELMRTAPNDFARGLLYGNILMRMTIAGITGRDFD